jgi:hypothetical protein
MERRLIEIHNQGIVSEDSLDEEPNPEQVDPKEFEAFFKHLPGHLVLSVRLSHG